MSKFKITFLMSQRDSTRKGERSENFTLKGATACSQERYFRLLAARARDLHPEARDLLLRWLAYGLPVGGEWRKDFFNPFFGLDQDTKVAVAGTVGMWAAALGYPEAAFPVDAQGVLRFENQVLRMGNKALATFEDRSQDLSHLKSTLFYSKGLVGAYLFNHYRNWLLFQTAANTLEGANKPSKQWQCLPKEMQIALAQFGTVSWSDGVPADVMQLLTEDWLKISVDEVNELRKAAYPESP